MKKSWQKKAKERLDELGMEQKNFADALNVSESAVSHWLKGRHQPTLKRLEAIATVLRMSFSELVEDDEAFVRDIVEQSILQHLREVPEDKREQASKLIEAVLQTLKLDPPE